VQVGAFRQSINADQLVVRLREDGYQPVIRRAGGLYVVQIGSFTDRAAAERLASRLRARRYDALVLP
jgi:N-acetylmuramoyl-L-alanine amidase